jgi:hypothetical protein
MDDTGFCGDDETRLIGSKGFADQAFADRRAVAVSGINEVDSQLHRPLKYFLCVGGIAGFTKEAFPCNAHGSIAKSVDFEPTDLNGFGVLPKV